MRISTSSVFDSGTSRMNDLQAALQKSQEMISSGSRILTAADDPVAAARALEVTQGQSINKQFGVNRNSVQASLSQEESTLQGVTDLLQQARELSISAGNGTLDVTQLKFMATDLKGQYDQLLGQANSRDAIGNYVFSGYQTNTQPFSESSTGVTYNGDGGARMMQVATTRQMAQSDSGDSVFNTIKNGNGRFSAAPVAPAANTGTGIISQGTVTGNMSSDNFKIVFGVGGTTYSVFNVTTDPTMAGVPESTGPYVDGQPISLDGGARQVEIKGVPAAGDTFNVNPSKNQSIFETLKSMISLLSNSSNSLAGKAELANGLASATQNISNALDNVLTIRASVGSRLQELDSLNADGDNRNLLFANSLRDLRDLDYVKAISDVSQQTMTLEAAQKSFVKVTGLSLFNFI